MGKLAKTNQSQQQSGTQTNQFQYIDKPENKYLTKAAGLVDNYDGGAGAIREGAARNVNQINESGNSFLGAGKTPAYAADKIRENRLFNNNLEMARGLAGANQNASQVKQQGYMNLGAATDPNFVQTGSTTTGSSSGSMTASPLTAIGQIGGIMGA